MKTELWLPTKAAADALGISTNTLKCNEIKNQALALIQGSGRQWTTKEISQTIGCNQEHARRILQLLLTEDKVSRRKLPSTGGHPVYAYTE